MNELETNRANFLSAVQYAGCLAGRARTLSYNECIKISVSGNVIEMSSTDNESYITYSYKSENEIQSPSCVAVEKNKLSLVLNSIKDENIKLLFDGNNLKVKHTKGEILLLGIDSELFPVQNKEREIISRSNVLACDFANVLTLSKGFIDRNDVYNLTNGVNIRINDGYMKFYSTEAHMLFSKECKCENKIFQESVSFTVSGRAIDSIVSVCSRCENVSISVRDRSILIDGDDVCLTSILRDGVYPDVSKAISGEKGKEKTFTKKELIESVNRMQISVGVSSKLVFNFSEKSFVTISSSGENGEFVEEKIPCTGDLSENFSVNSSFILTALKTVKSEKVTLETTGGAKAIFITDDSDPSVVIMVMPMM